MTRKAVCRTWPFALIAGGCLLIVGSFTYWILSVGIPGPETPPEILARQQTKENLAFMIFLLGSLTFVLGALAGLTKLARWMIRSRH